MGALEVVFISSWEKFSKKGRYLKQIFVLKA
jgi:hypothetical protein